MDSAKKADRRPVKVSVVDTMCARDSKLCEALKRPGGYQITFDNDTVRVLGADTTGVSNGLQTLTSVVRNSPDRLPAGVIADWPDHPVRAIHFVVRNVNTEVAQALVRKAWAGRFNTLVMQIADGVRLPGMERMARSDAWTTQEFMSFVEFARSYGMRVVPEIKLLSHQNKLFKQVYPELMYNHQTYDPREPEVYQRVFRIIDGLIALIDPGVIHIGHDEVAGVGAKSDALRFGEAPLPPPLFLKDVRRLYGFLSDRGVEVWMWGDMLVSPEEFPEIHQADLNGTPQYAALRDSIPDDIVICDWHYYDSGPNYPTVDAFVANGNPVIGTTWKNESVMTNFSRYVDGAGESGVGMMATTWFHVQRGEWTVVDRIIERSGSAFWNSGPRK